MAINKARKEEVFLLAQSDMSAPEIQILKIPNDADITFWHSAFFIKEMRTTE